MKYAIGMIETYGHTAATEALDSAFKASNIFLPSLSHIGGGIVTVVFFGDVAAVRVAVDCGVAAAEKVGKVLASHVIARLDKQVLDTLFAYASSNNNTVEDGSKEIKENEEKNIEEKEAEENKQSESNTEIINENADNSSSNINVDNASLFDEDVNKKTDNEAGSSETVSKKKTRKKKKNDNQ